MTEAAWYYPQVGPYTFTFTIQPGESLFGRWPYSSRPTFDEARAEALDRLNNYRKLIDHNIAEISRLTEADVIARHTKNMADHAKNTAKTRHTTVDPTQPLA